MHRFVRAVPPPLFATKGTPRLHRAQTGGHMGCAGEGGCLGGRFLQLLKTLLQIDAGQFREQLTKNKNGMEFGAQWLFSK